MNTTSIDIEVLEKTSEFVAVKLPFLKIPVQMNHQFFKKRLESGYFRIVNHQSLTNTRGQEEEQN